MLFNSLEVGGDVRVVFSVTQDSIHELFLFLFYINHLPVILENALVGYADDCTLLAEVPEPGTLVQAVLSLNRDLVRIGD